MRISAVTRPHHWSTASMGAAMGASMGAALGVVALGVVALAVAACSSSRPSSAALGATTAPTDVAEVDPSDTDSGRPESRDAGPDATETSVAETGDTQAEVHPGVVFCPAKVQDLSGLGDFTVSSSTVASSNDFPPACVDTGDAPDQSFTFRPEKAGLYTFTTRGSSLDTVLILRHDCGSQVTACDHGASGDGASAITTTLAARETVVLTVDGFAGASGDFVLQVVAGGIGEDCTNGVDDDGDGAIDCKDDFDCAGNPACVESECHDGADNDHDGLSDCADPDCAWVAGCVETACGNGEDDDGDGAVDCADRDCAFDAGCREDCTDGVDNNGNGAIDCADLAHCGDDPACAESSCSDGIDNDGDGDVDCRDSNCWGDPACYETKCGDGRDDDGDLHVDCADVDCQADTTACLETQCSDHVDNDGDGMTDCEDSSCSSDPACTETGECADRIDNDGDGLTDCDDWDCSDEPACRETDCTDGRDDDGDGATDCDDGDCAADPACGEAGRCQDHIDNDEDGASDCDDIDCSADPACHETACTPGRDDDGDGASDCGDADCVAATTLGSSPEGLARAALDGAGGLHVVSGGRHLVRAADGTWSSEDLAAGLVYDTTLRVDHEGGLHVAFVASSAAGSEVRYGYRAAKAGASWEFSVVQSSPEVNAFFGVDLAVDGKRNVHLIFQVIADDILDYATLPWGGAWSTTVIDAGASGRAVSLTYPQLAVDSAGVVHVVYVPQSDFLLHHARLAPGGRWSWDWVEAGVLGYLPVAAIDAQDRLHVVYQDRHDIGPLRHAILGAGGWSVAPLDAPRVYSPIGLAIDAHATLHLTYEDGLTEVLRYVRITSAGGANEQRVAVADPSTGAAVVPDAGGGAHLVFVIRDDAGQALSHLYLCR